MNCVCCTTKRGIYVNIATSFGMRSQTSNTSNQGVVNGIEHFKNVTLIDDV